MHSSTAQLLAELAANAARPFSESRSLPPAAYHDEGIAALELSAIFRREWICIGRAAEIPQPGDYVSRDIIDTPVLVVRQKDRTVKAFGNLCLHRSAKLLQGEGHVTRISCPYHSWTYDIDGQLVGAPFMSQTPGFETADYRLRALPCDEWEGFVYVSLDPAAMPLSGRLAGLSGLVGGYRMRDYVPVFSREELWHTNWKCLVENFMDAYHIHRVHRQSFARYGSSEQQTELHDGEDAYSYHFVQEDSGDKSVEAHPDNTWLTGADRHRTWLICVFPCHTIQLQPDMLWYLSILPAGAGCTSIRWAVSIPAEILDAAKIRETAIDEVLALLHKVNGEDRPVVENVFKATSSPQAVPGPLSYLERNVWQFSRYLSRTLVAGI